MELVEGGYTNRLSAREGGGATAVARLTAVDLRETRHAAPSVALRGDVGSSGSRLAIGGDATFLLRPGWNHDWTPFARTALWCSPLRGGVASSEASILTPGLDFGALFYSSRRANSRRVLELGARVDYTFIPDRLAESTVWTLYVGIGSSDSLNVP